MKNSYKKVIQSRKKDIISTLENFDFNEVYYLIKQNNIICKQTKSKTIASAQELMNIANDLLQKVKKEVLSGAAKDSYVIYDKYLECFWRSGYYHLIFRY